ncbi:MAG: hypothetical protein D6803_00865 [Anaerolineae bacterium]|nr:MAG: hypothetical protein D6803_00865 [Anaerolineae bacterium]
MAKPQKFDGVIETVHYNPDGKIEWVRAYLRHGFVFSDVMLLKREALMQRLKKGARFFTGRRLPFQGNRFEIQHPVRLIGSNGSEHIVAGDAPAEDRDSLAGVHPL